MHLWCFDIFCTLLPQEVIFTFPSFAFIVRTKRFMVATHVKVFKITLGNFNQVGGFFFYFVIFMFLDRLIIAF